MTDLGDIRDEWIALAEATKNVFSTWDWNAIASSHLGSGRTPLVTACRAPDGRVVAVLPLYVWRGRPLRIIRLIGHEVGDQLGPICRPGMRPAVARAVADALDFYRADIFVAEHLPVEEGWRHLLHAKVLSLAASPVLSFDAGTWDEFLASCSSNLRSQIRGRERKLLRNHDVRYRLTSTRDQLDQDLDTLFALHTARWPGELTTFARHESFHREFATCAFDRGWLRLWLLEVDEQPRAAWYGFRFAGIESFYQSGRDPEWDAHSVGFVLFVHSIREALKDGMSEYRLLRGDEPHKYRFANSDPGLETIGIARGVAARAALASARVAGRSGAFRSLFSAYARG